MSQLFPSTTNIVVGKSGRDRGPGEWNGVQSRREDTGEL